MVDSNSPIGYIIIGLVMLLLCKYVLRFHMWIIEKRVGKAKMDKFPNLWKWYKKIFFITWILLGAGIVMVHSVRLFS